MSEPTVRSALDGSRWTLSDFLAQLACDGRGASSPFAEISTSFVTRLSQALFKAPDARRFPEIVSLAYWLRPGPVAAHRQAFTALSSDDVILVPRGLAFHVPPANVDTMFVYSWVLSLLVGNRNVVRISDRLSEVVGLLLGVLAMVLADPAHAEVSRRNWFVHTGHDDEISRALSASSDVRVVWGGDSTVRHFRQFELPMHGRDLSFPNRHSFSVLDAPSVAAAERAALRAVANAFFNDAYWFDQAGCSSPRLIVWHAPDNSPVDEARRRFHHAVGEAIAARGYHAQTGTAIDKLVFGYGAAITRPTRQIDVDSNEVTWVWLDDLNGYDRRHCGGGLFFEVVSRDLENDLARFVKPVDQTAAIWGLPPNRVLEIAKRINGRGVDRWVPLGHALNFDRIWDGMDLLQEFSKRVVVRTEERRA